MGITPLEIRKQEFSKKLSGYDPHEVRSFLEISVRIGVRCRIMGEQPGATDNRLVFIGHIETPYATPEDCPYTVNPGGPICRVVLDAPYAPGLNGLEVGARVLVLCPRRDDRGPLP